MTRKKAPTEPRKPGSSGGKGTKTDALWTDLAWLWLPPRYLSILQESGIPHSGEGSNLFVRREDYGEIILAMDLEGADHWKEFEHTERYSVLTELLARSGKDTKFRRRAIAAINLGADHLALAKLLEEGT